MSSSFLRKIISCSYKVLYFSDTNISAEKINAKLGNNYPHVVALDKSFASTNDPKTRILETIKVFKAIEIVNGVQKEDFFSDVHEIRPVYHVIDKYGKIDDQMQLDNIPIHEKIYMQIDLSMIYQQ